MNYLSNEIGQTLQQCLLTPILDVCLVVPPHVSGALISTNAQPNVSY